MGDVSSPTLSRPVVIISEPHQSYSLNSKFKVGLLNPFLYDSVTSYHISSINSALSVASVTGIKVHTFSGSNSRVFACGGFLEYPFTNAALWEINPDSGELTRIAHYSTNSASMKELTFSEDSGIHYVYSTTSESQ